MDRPKCEQRGERDAPGSPDVPADQRELIAAARRQTDRLRRRLRAVGMPVGLAIPDGPAAEPLPKDSFQGYEVLAEIHRGGQGVVYQARQQSTGRTVAIKVMKEGPFAGAADRVRFEREVDILAHLQHPSIVTIHDSGSASGCFYYVMDYIAGQPLDVYMASGRHRIEDTLRLFAKICDAVGAAHMRGVIHRDLKPGNVRIDEQGQPHVLDFGLAKVSRAEDAHGAVTVTGQFIGSLPWSAPEQVTGRAADVDTRTDVYALGVILFQMLTGKFPYSVTGAAHDVMERILHSDPARPSAMRRGVNDELDTIVLRCLHKERERRYDSAGSLARDVRRYLAGEPIEAKRDSGWYLFRKALRRHRVPLAFAVLAAVFGVALLAGLVVSHRHQTRLRAEAERQAAIAEAVNRFLNEDLLAAVKPQQMGRAVTVREVLDAASARVGAQFAAEPIIEAAIRETLGHTYMELGEWPAALAHAERALELRRARLGDRHPDTLSALQLVGRLYRRLGRYEAAYAALKEMVDSARATLGPEHPLTTQGMNNLAYALEELGRNEEALARNREVLEIRTRTLGLEHPETLRSLHNQGYYVEQFGRYVEAERLYARAYELREEVLGPNHPDTLSSMANLANVWTRLGRWEDAEQMHLKRLERARAVFGEQHPRVLRNLGVLADIYRRQGRRQEAEALLMQVLEGWRQGVGDSHRQVAATQRRLGELYAEQGRFGEAESLFLRALDVYRDTVGVDRVQTYLMAGVLGRFYLERGRYAEAEPLLIEAVDGLRGHFGSEHDTHRAARRTLEQLYDAWPGERDAHSAAAGPGR